MIWGLISIIFFSAFFGGILPKLINWENKYFNLKDVLGFCGAFLMGIVFLHLIPEVFENTSKSTLSYWILFGFILQLFLDFLSQGIEHGHTHKLHGTGWSIIIPVMVGLSVHSLFEGLPIEMMPENERTGLVLAILLHKIPAAFALGIVIRNSNFSTKGFYLLIFIFALMTPLGLIIGASGIFDMIDVKVIIAIIIGSFLHISTTILFESDDVGKHQINYKKLSLISLGFLLAILIHSSH